MPAATARLACCAAAAALLSSAAATGSSHREASFITNFPKLDGTDLYAFMSYEPGREGYVTLIANYGPMQDPFSGPFYHTLDEDAYYEIHIDSDGDAKEDLVFRFETDKRLGGQDEQGLRVTVGDRSLASPLKFTGPVAAGDVARLNERETYVIDVVRGGVRGPGDPATNAATGAAKFEKAADYAGTKLFGAAASYESYARSYIYTLSIPGCDRQGRVFVGPRKDPFRANLGRLFDLGAFLPVDATAAASGIAQSEANDVLDEKNVTTFALEVHSSCLKGSGNGVIGVWTTSSLPQVRVLNPNPTFYRPDENGGPMLQVSRVGMPLVNMLLIGIPDKNRYNSMPPSADARFADYVRYPTLPEILDGLFRSPVNQALGRADGTIAPTVLPRHDLESAFLTGLKGVNRQATVTSAEMLRLNMNVAAKPAAQQRSLGVLADDLAGFPNGRRPGDDVVDVVLRLLMGRLCHALSLGGQTADVDAGCQSGQAPAGALPFTDGAPVSAADFDERFPYLRTPIPGSAFPEGAAFVAPR